MEIIEYKEFLKQKQIVTESVGIDIDRDKLNPILFEFQKDCVRWALKKGRAALFEDCGLGKTFQQLEWSKHICEHTGGDILILAPLAVSTQTIKEGEKLGIIVNLAESQKDIKPGINITNYEKLHKFNPEHFIGVVLDESSILKAYTSKTRNKIINSFEKTPYKLACTATPAPNDFMELGNHSEFLGVMTRGEMLGMYFVHDGSRTSDWRIKGHAQDKFWKWVSSWAVMLRKPSDLNYKDGKFKLPPLNVKQITVKPKHKPKETLFHVKAESLMERRRARRDSIEDRVNAAAELINNSNEDTWLIWCDLNDESKMLADKIEGAYEVTGSQSNDKKEELISKYSNGDIKRLVSKPSICGHGLNWQHCSNVVFVGLSDSYEQYYQAVRRTWRFGQKNPVNVYIITAETEGNVVENIQRKERDNENMAEQMAKHMKDLNIENVRGTRKEIMDYEVETKTGKDYEMYLGDSVEVLKDFEDNSIHYSIFSPPFADLYTYTNSDRDMGNCRNETEFYQHFKYLVKELYRVIKPGRLVSFHCMNLPTTKAFDGYIGIRDFRGMLIKIFQEEGWIFHSEVCIWKDPVVAMQRTKALGLLYRQLKKDSTMSRQGIPDYLVSMRKPGDNPEYVSHKPKDFPLNDWRDIASPVWTDINQSNTLQYRSAREEQDEKHICPLQLDVIKRGLLLYSNPKDIILSPFTGIGSEGYQSLIMDRKFKGIELKRSYFEQAVNNLELALQEKLQMSLFN